LDGLDRFGIIYLNSTDNQRIEISYHPSGSGSYKILFDDAVVGTFHSFNFDKTAGVGAEYWINSYFHYSEEYLSYHMTEVICNMMIPYVNEIKPLMVYTDIDMYEELSICTHQKTVLFAKTYGTSSSYTLKESIHLLQKSLLAWRGLDLQKRQSTSIKKRDSIILAAAYLGELYISASIEKAPSFEWTWEWIMTSQGEKFSYAINPKVGIVSNPLSAIVYFWNHYPNLFYADLSPMFISREIWH